MSLAKQEIAGLYNEVKSSVSHALTDINSISLKDEEGQQHIDKIKERLEEVAKSFNQEIDNLEKNSEWEKFTIAFFGETNAGKSTIIESLRIIFKEKERQKQIENGEIQLEELEKSFSKNSDELIQVLNQNLSTYSSEMRNIEKQISEIKRESKQPINNFIVVVIGILVGVLLMFIFQMVK